MSLRYSFSNTLQLEADIAEPQSEDQNEEASSTSLKLSEELVYKPARPSDLPVSELFKNDISRHDINPDDINPDLLLGLRPVTRRGKRKCDSDPSAVNSKNELPGRLRSNKKQDVTEEKSKMSFRSQSNPSSLYEGNRSVLFQQNTAGNAPSTLNGEEFIVSLPVFQHR